MEQILHFLPHHDLYAISISILNFSFAKVSFSQKEMVEDILVFEYWMETSKNYTIFLHPDCKFCRIIISAGKEKR